jgi:predicted aspartyl protease
MTQYIIRSAGSADRLVDAGPLVPGSWCREHDDLGREIKGEFLIDTGASGAMIDLAVAEMLGLWPRGTKSVHGIHGYGSLQLFLARIYLPAIDAKGRPTGYSAAVECVGVPSLREKSLAQQADIIGILGRQFLRHASVTVDHLSGHVELVIANGPGEPL